MSSNVIELNLMMMLVVTPCGLIVSEKHTASIFRSEVRVFGKWMVHKFCQKDWAVRGNWATKVKD
jgi:hypothetical protein